MLKPKPPSYALSPLLPFSPSAPPTHTQLGVGGWGCLGRRRVPLAHCPLRPSFPPTTRECVTFARTKEASFIPSQPCSRTHPRLHLSPAHAPLPVSTFLMMGRPARALAWSHSPPCFQHPLEVCPHFVRPAPLVFVCGTCIGSTRVSVPASHGHVHLRCFHWIPN